MFVAVPAVSVLADLAYRRRPSTARLHARIALHCAAVTVVIYLSGWGPVLTGAYAFVALENLAHDGSRTWRDHAGWSLVGIAVGQVAICAGLDAVVPLDEERARAQRHGRVRARRS